MNRRPLVSPAAALAATAVLLTALVACGDDDSGDDGESAASESPATTSEPTTTTQPSATEDEEAAFEALREVFDERQQLMNELFMDPSLLDDPDSHHVQRLRELVTDEMAHTVDTNVEFTQRLADDGHRLQAAGEVMADWGIYRMETVDADTITFEVCSIEDSVKVNEAGDVVPDSNVVFGTFGVGEARRLDGIWRLHELVRDTDMDITEEDRTPGELFEGACDREFGEGEPETP